MTLPLDIETPAETTPSASAGTAPAVASPSAAGSTPAPLTLPGGAGSTPGAVAAGGAAPGQTAGAVVAFGEGAATAPVLPHIVGLDVSLTGTGVACHHGAVLVKSTGKKTDTLDDRQARLHSLVARIFTDIGHGGHGLPGLVVIEQPSYSRTGGSTHDRSGLWWFLVNALIRSGVCVVEIPATTLKKYATGRGNADKDQVLAAAIRRLPVNDIDNNNTADAAWLCALGHDLHGQPLCDLPAAQRAAIDKYRTGSA